MRTQMATFKFAEPPTRLHPLRGCDFELPRKKVTKMLNVKWDASSILQIKHVSRIKIYQYTADN